MKNPVLFFGGIVLAIVGIALGVFFLVPGVNHVIADSHKHIKHAAACFVLAILGILAAVINRPAAN